MTQLLLALLLSSPAAAQAPVDACRTGRVLEARPLRLSILPTDGSAPIEVLLRFAGCRTTDEDPVLGDLTPPTATRAFRAAGVGWEVDLATEDGGALTELYLYYRGHASKQPTLVTFFPEKSTAAVAGGRIDWGTARVSNHTPPKFDFKARVVTQ